MQINIISYQLCRVIIQSNKKCLVKPVFLMQNNTVRVRPPSTGGARAGTTVRVSPAKKKKQKQRAVAVVAAGAVCSCFLNLSSLTKSQVRPSEQEQHGLLYILTKVQTWRPCCWLIAAAFLQAIQTCYDCDANLQLALLVSLITVAPNKRCNYDQLRYLHNW